MSRIIMFLLLNSIICLGSVLAQNNGEKPVAKPATDACPTWNNKQNISKADYFMFLRKTSKATKTTKTIEQYNQTNKNFDKPLYSAIVPQKKIPVNNGSEQDLQLPIETETNSSQQIESPPSIPNIGVKSVQGKPEKETKPDLKIIPENNTEVNKSVDSSKQEEEKNATIEKAETKKKSSFLKLPKTERKHWLRKIKLRKKGAAKCPDF